MLSESQLAGWCQRLRISERAKAVIHQIRSSDPARRVGGGRRNVSGRYQETIGERFERDRERLLPLPAAPLDACQQRTTRVDSQALVRYETNDYSVPVEYGHRQVLVKAFVREVAICCSREVIARHRRSYDREEMIFDPLHYLALLEQKTNALDASMYAAAEFPLMSWVKVMTP